MDTQDMTTNDVINLVNITAHETLNARIESIKLAYSIFNDLNNYDCKTWQSLNEDDQRDAFQELFVIANLIYNYITGNDVELPD